MTLSAVYYLQYSVGKLSPKFGILNTATLQNRTVSMNVNNRNNFFNNNLYQFN